MLQDPSGTPPPTSHRPVYIDMERSPTRMGEYMGESYAAEVVSLNFNKQFSFTVKCIVSWIWRYPNTSKW